MTNHLTRLAIVGFAILGTSVHMVAQRPSLDEVDFLQRCKLRGIERPAYCGTYSAFENRRDRKGRKIDLRVVVVPAPEKARLADPLVVFVGGPGQAATPGAAGFVRRWAEISKRRDILLVDQRGTGASNGLKCDFDGMKGMFEAFVEGRFDLVRVEKCRQELETRADLRFYSTENAVDDLADIARAIGYRQLNLYGGSYGTRPAILFLRRHPDLTRTVTLRGVFSMNPSYFARDTEAALQALLQDCARDERCSGAYPSLTSRLKRLLTKLDSNPGAFRIRMQDGRYETFEITSRTFLGGIRRMLYDSATQSRVPLMISKAEKGDYYPVEQMAQRTRGLLGSFSVGMFFSVACSEGVKQTAVVPTKMKGRHAFYDEYMAASARESCSKWPASFLSSEYFNPIRSGKPVLILSGEIDPVTPPLWGDVVAKNLTNSRHFRMKGIAHGPFPPCGIGIMTELVDEGSVKELNTECLSRLTRPKFVLPNRIVPIKLETAEPVSRELIVAEERWLGLAAAADRKGLRQFLHPDFRQVTAGSDGAVTKDAWIERVLSLTSQVESGVFRIISPKVLVDGERAVVKVKWSFEGFRGARAFGSTIAVEDHWVRSGGGWRPIKRILGED